MTHRRKQMVPNVVQFSAYLQRCNASIFGRQKNGSISANATRTRGCDTLPVERAPAFGAAVHGGMTAAARDGKFSRYQSLGTGATGRVVHGHGCKPCRLEWTQWSQSCMNPLCECALANLIHFTCSEITFLESSCHR